MTFPFVANLISGMGALACIGMIPLWILGVPGTTNSYAKGWMMGFQVLWMYPTAFLGEFAFFALARWLAGPGGSGWAVCGGWVSLALLLAAACRMTVAWRIML